jgi:hypothetical protein
METAIQENKYVKGNELIHIFMGWALMTPQEIVDYSVSPMRIGRGDIDPVVFINKHSHLPNMKKKDAVITQTSHNDIFYSDHLTYNHSLDSLIPVIEKIRDRFLKKGIDGREDLMYTFQYLLDGGYKFGALTPLPKLNFSVENIWSRIVMMLNYYNIK